MNYAYLFAGMAIGFIVPWIIMLAMIRNKELQTSGQVSRLESANELLSERNEIGRRQCVALEEIVEALHLNSPSEGSDPNGLTMKVRKDSPEHAEYLKARFDGGLIKFTFMFAGHRWRYEYSSFDDSGEFDLLWRPAENDGAKYENHAKAALVAALKRFDQAYTDDQLTQLAESENGTGEISPKHAQKLIQLRQALALAGRREA